MKCFENLKWLRTYNEIKLRKKCTKYENKTIILYKDMMVHTEFVNGSYELKVLFTRSFRE